jgi:hypothetical protein
MDWLVRWTGKSFDAARSNEAADESGVATSACRIMLNMTGSEKISMKRDSGARASGCFCAPTKNPHEMGSQKGNVKIWRKTRRLQVVDRIGSSGRIRTYNPPVNSRKKKR